MELDLQTTPIFLKNYEATKPIVINRGGTRSSKTYSLAQLHVTRLASEPNKRMLISRKTFPSLRSSVMQDIIDMLKFHGIYNPADHNKTEHIYTFPYTGSEFRFLSIDDPQKIRGPEWNYAWFNEANEMTYEDFKQVYMRMTRKSADGKPNLFYIDFNPSDEDVWINLKIEQSTQYEFDLIKSTFKDNTFLPEHSVNTILNMEEHDPEYWQIYGLGEYGKLSGQIFKNWKVVDEFPKPQFCKWVAYGLDFGFSNDPTSICKVALSGGELWVKGLCYRIGLTNQDICRELEANKIRKQQEIIADSAEPKSIEEIHRDGWNVKGARKGPDSIRHGIDTLRQYTINIVDGDEDLKKEFRNYKWATDKEGKLLNKPVDMYNHYIDGIRYVALNKIGRISVKAKGAGTSRRRKVKV